MNTLAEHDLGQVDRILILGWGLIGDLFIRVPLIEAIKERFPEARITVVVDPICVTVLENHPACDRVIAFSREKRPLKSYVQNYITQVMGLRRENFDLCVNLYCGGGSPLISQLVNARTRICFDHTPELCRANNLMVPRPSFCKNWTHDLGRMLAPIGIPKNKIRRGTSYYCSQEAKEFAEKFLAENSASLLGVNLGAGADEKRWPVGKFVEFSIRANREYGLKPLVFTNPGMEQLADEFVSQYSCHGELLHAPLSSIDQVGALMEWCDFVITGDTALMHLAFGLKRPTLALFTYTRPETVEPEDTPNICCFVPGTRDTDACGSPMGTVEIPLDEAYLQFSNLVKFVSNETGSC